MEHQDKQQQSAALKESIKDLDALVLVTYDRLTVAEADELRNRLRDAGCTYRVYKNSIVRYAVEGTGHEVLKESLKGVNGLAYNAEDPGGPARVVTEYMKENKKVSVNAAVMGGELLTDEAQIKRLADLPSPDQLKSMFLQLLQTPATNMVRVLNAPAGNFLNVLNAKKDKDAA